jgi:hypothetical protein
MKNNKIQFIADCYIDVEDQETLLAIIPKLVDVAFFVEPWPGNNWRVYVRKDASHLLEDIGEAIENEIQAKKGKKSN